MTVWATRADQVDLRGPNPHDLARSPMPSRWTFRLGRVDQEFTVERPCDAGSRKRSQPARRAAEASIEAKLVALPSASDQRMADDGRRCARLRAGSELPPA